MAFAVCLSDVQIRISLEEAFRHLKGNKVNKVGESPFELVLVLFVFEFVLLRVLLIPTVQIKNAATHVLF